MVAMPKSRSKLLQLVVQVVYWFCRSNGTWEFEADWKVSNINDYGRQGKKIPVEGDRMLEKDNTLNPLNVANKQWTVQCMALLMISKQAEKSNKKYSHLIKTTIWAGNAGKDNKVKYFLRFNQSDSIIVSTQRAELTSWAAHKTTRQILMLINRQKIYTHTHTITYIYTYKSWRGDVPDKTLVKMCFMANIALRLRWRCTSLSTFLIKLMLRPFRLAWLRPNNVVNSFFAHFCVVRTSPGSHSPFWATRPFVVLVANFVLSTNAIKGSWSGRLEICFNSPLKRCMCN